MRACRGSTGFRTMAWRIEQAERRGAMDGAVVMYKKEGAAYVTLGNASLVVKEYPPVGTNIDRYLMVGLA